MTALRFVRTKYRLYLRAGIRPRHALQRAVCSLFTIY